MGSQKRNSKATSGLQLRRDESMGFFFCCAKGKGKMCEREREMLKLSMEYKQNKMKFGL